MPRQTGLPPLLYIHGFGSSGRCTKANVLREEFDKVYAPNLSHIPELAMETLKEFIWALGEPPVLVGSSLGGFYALHLSDRFGLPAVMINPVVPGNVRDLNIAGIHNHGYDGSRFEFTPAHQQSLEKYRVEEPDVGRLLLLLQMGDELLDHDVTLQVLDGAETVRQSGGEHKFVDFQTQLPTVTDFVSRWQPQRSTG